MNIERVLKVEEIDLSDPEFWARPLEEREGAFSVLRAESPIPFVRERQIPDIPIPPGPGLSRNFQSRFSPIPTRDPDPVLEYCL